jgi:hypothetical protein
MRSLALALLALGSTPLAPTGQDIACPPTFKQAAGACDPRVSAGHVCTYPEGRCTCVRSIPCSGVPSPPGEPQWRCHAARTDGCPDAQPAQGSACTKPGKKCSYGDCGSIELTCDGKTRKWLISGGAAPPPSAPGPPPAPPLKPTPVAAPSWKHCPANRHFGCEPRSQGVAPAPGDTIPEVCGCIPSCPPSRRALVAQEAEGTWPDGTRKGNFSCAENGIP